MLLARMKGASPKAAAALAHTLAGSARGIGALEVARAAQEVELAAQGSLRAETASAVRALGQVVARAQAAIKELLGTN
jgi:HPt (histidine-containing phosphotransfer) domain-containing protein